MDETGNNKIKSEISKNSNINSNDFCCGKCCSKISITIQFIIYFIPIISVLIFIMIMIHVYLLSEVLKFDFYTAIKEEILKYFLTDLDDINFDLNKKKFLYLLKIFQIWLFSEYISKNLVHMDY